MIKTEYGGIDKSEKFVQEENNNQLLIKKHSLPKRIGSFIDRIR